MRRAALVAVFVLATASGLAAQAWMAVTNQTGRLEVLMPCTGMWQTEVKQGTGPEFPYTSTLLLCRAGDEIYIIGWVDYPAAYRPATAAELRANQDNFIKGVNGVLSTSTEISHGGLPALEFTGSINAQQISGRAIMDGARPYMAVALTPLGQDRAANIRKFLTSYQITPR